MFLPENGMSCRMAVGVLYSAVKLFVLLIQTLDACRECYGLSVIGTEHCVIDKSAIF